MGDEVHVAAGYTDWASVSSLQRKIFRAENVGPPENEDSYHAWLASQEAIRTTGRPDRFPHHLAVHPLVLCNDGFVVCCVRSKVTHQPGRLSLSIEEQMQPAHIAVGVPGRNATLSKVKRVDGDAGPMAAVVRGVKEELGISIGTDQVEVLGVAIERTSIAVNMISLVRLEQNLEQVRTSWRSAEDSEEIELLCEERSIRLPDVGHVAHWKEALAKPRVDQWHSSSRLRLLLALLRTERIEATRFAFSDVEVAHVIDRISSS